MNKQYVHIEAELIIFVGLMNLGRTEKKSVDCHVNRHLGVIQEATDREIRLSGML